MFYRRKLLLALLQKINSPVNKIDFEKYLFLFTELQITHRALKTYHFIPYKYGPFSLQSYADISVLSNQNIVCELESKLHLNTKYDYIDELTDNDKVLLEKLATNFFHISGDNLIKKVYIEYPYYAINSTIANKLLDDDSLKRIEFARPHTKSQTLFTIGYEGIDLDDYINRLLVNNVKVLCDIRKNPFSMKWGFSKKLLKSSLENVNINYIHIPELGIESSERANLHSKNDYIQLFKKYMESTIPKASKEINLIKTLLNDYQRVALTCFEHEQTFCHRGEVVKVLQNSTEWSIPIKHL
jgi:uncharacterized protein (DUF488 family)